jgi:pimeloyl-ACP methyl ester carboxylesterase
MADLDHFTNFGPLAVSERRSLELATDVKNTVVLDHFFGISSEPLPIVVITHGNYSGRRAHDSQARQLASWGYHVLVVELPNRNQWLENGQRLKSLTEMIYRWPKFIGENVDQARIVLVGHSFGGSASVLAASHGAPVLGLVLLDPAVVHPDVRKKMQDLDLPVVLLGADKRVYTSRGRDSFWKFIFGEILEVSVRDATHDDAQGPSVFSRSTLGVDPFTSRKKQDIFRSMLTVSVIGLSTSGTIDFPQIVFKRAENQGILQNLRGRGKRSATRVMPIVSKN